MDLLTHMQRHGIKGPFRVVPNVINPDIFYPSISSNRRGDLNKRILFVALLNPVKGVDYLLKAISIIHKKRGDFILQIIGDGPERHNLEVLAKELGLESKVFFLGIKGKEDVAQFMRQSDFLVLTSHWENQPNVLLEAMACGLPVVATKVGGVPEIVSPECGILVTPGDVKEIASGIEELMENTMNYSAEAISQYAHQRFSYSTVGRQFDEVYHEVVESHR
jgi:glycosyltransferase involved in cell wall biosynthesis